MRWVVAGAAWALCACDGQDATKTVRERSEAVTGKASGATSAAPSGTSGSATSGRAEPRALCTAKPSGKAPDSPINVRAAAGATALPAPIPFGAGKWIWVNLWAAWCGPCKEEMPLMVRWQHELRKKGVLVDLAFVSVDDDERQLMRFLEGQPADGVRATYLLPEGKRDKWLGALGVASAPRLPVHAFVSPKGELRCLIDGELGAPDFPRIAALLGG